MSCIACCLCECTACIACTCCQKGLNGLLSISARLGHVALVVTIFSLASILGTQYPNKINGYNSYTQVDLTLYCSDGEDDTCIYRQLIYRASFALFLMLLFLVGGTYFSEYLNRSYWPMKFGLTTTLFVAFWWGSNGFFNGWAEFTRIFSLIWLLFQGLLMIDFAHDCHDAIIMKSDEDEKEEEGGGRKWLIFYMFLSLGFLSCGGLGLAYLFMNYSGCSLGTFFIVVTLIFGVGCLIVSLLNAVNKGFLTPAIMFAYSVFMCWYALLSSPSIECNPNAADDNGYQWVSSCVFICMRVYRCVYMLYIYIYIYIGMYVYISYMLYIVFKTHPIPPPTHTHTHSYI